MKIPAVKPFVLLLAAFLALSCSDETTTAPPTYSISGTVHQDGTGSAVAEADVIAQRHEDGTELGRTVTDADGRFLLNGLPAEVIDVVVEADGFAPMFFSSLDPKTDENALNNMSVQMTMADSCCSGALILTLKNANGELLVNKAVVIKRAGQIIADPRTNEQGKITEDNLCAGEYSIRIAVDGYKVYEAVFVINPDCDTVEMTAVLQNAETGCCSGVFTLVVRDANGNPVVGAKVQVRIGSKTIEDPRTDANGRIVVDGLCKGEYNYRVSKEGYNVVEGMFAINASCEPVTREATLTSTGVCCSGVFTLIVRDANGNPVQGAKVVIKKSGTVIEDPVTNGDGRIVVDGLCKGEYSYRITREGFNVVEGSFAINELCEPVTKEATLAANSVCCSGVLTVTVVDSTNAPIEGATVKLWQNGAVKETRLSNAQGVAVFDGLCKGEYGVDIIKTGFNSKEFVFAINGECDPFTKLIELVP